MLRSATAAPPSDFSIVDTRLKPWTKYRPIPDILTRCGDAQHVKTVVPPTVLVHGISGLRVADGSVMPSIPSANTAATVYAIAERAAELIGG